MSNIESVGYIDLGEEFGLMVSLTDAKSLFELIISQNYDKIVLDFSNVMFIDTHLICKCEELKHFHNINIINAEVGEERREWINIAHNLQRYWFGYKPYFVDTPAMQKAVRIMQNTE